MLIIALQSWQSKFYILFKQFSSSVIKALAIAIRTIAKAIAIVAKKAIEYCNMQ